MVWKKVVNTDSGDADHFGGDDLDKISDLFSGVNADDVSIGADFKFLTNRLRVANTDNTFVYKIQGSAVTADRTITIPLVTGNDTFATLDMDQTWTGTNAFNESIALRADIAPAQITSNQNNYDPAGLSTANILRLSSDASRDITGINDYDGKILTLINIGSFDIVLRNQSSSSLDENRLLLGGDITLTPNQVITLWYDQVSIKWRPVVTTTTSSSDIPLVAEPASPASGYIRMFGDIVDGKLKIKRSNGDVVIIE